MNFPWEIDSISIKNLNLIVEQRWGEDLSIEFKQEMYPSNRTGTLELLRDVTAMVNADGGYIFIGIAQDRHGRACKITPLGMQESLWSKEVF